MYIGRQKTTVPDPEEHNDVHPPLHGLRNISSSAPALFSFGNHCLAPSLWLDIFRSCAVQCLFPSVFSTCPPRSVAPGLHGPALPQPCPTCLGRCRPALPQCAPLTPAPLGPCPDCPGTARPFACAARPFA
jgi:hypothetical protein